MLHSLPGDSVLDTPRHQHYDRDLDTDPESCNEQSECPGDCCSHNSSDNAVTKQPYRRQSGGRDSIDGMSPEIMDGTLPRLFHPSVPPGSLRQEGVCMGQKGLRSASLGRHSRYTQGEGTKCKSWTCFAGFFDHCPCCPICLLSMGQINFVSQT